MTHVHKLCADSDTCILERLGFLEVIDHLLRLIQHIRHRVHHREIRVSEQTELILNHVPILGIESSYVQRSGNRTELIQLLITDLRIESGLRLDIMIRINTYTSDIFASKLLRHRRVAITLTKAGTKESRLVNLPVQTRAKNRTHRAKPTTQLDIRLFILVIHPVVLQTHSGAQRQLVRNTMVILQICRQIIGMVSTRHIRCIGDMIPVNTCRQTHAVIPLFGKLIIDISVISQLRTSRRVIR